MWNDLFSFDQIIIYYLVKVSLQKAEINDISCLQDY
jgi:hypothetical protein